MRNAHWGTRILPRIGLWMDLCVSCASDAVARVYLFTGSQLSLAHFELCCRERSTGKCLWDDDFHAEFVPGSVCIDHWTTAGSVKHRERKSTESKQAGTKNAGGKRTSRENAFSELPLVAHSLTWLSLSPFFLLLQIGLRNLTPVCSNTLSPS